MTNIFDNFPKVQHVWVNFNNIKDAGILSFYKERGFFGIPRRYICLGVTEYAGKIDCVVLVNPNGMVHTLPLGEWVTQ